MSLTRSAGGETLSSLNKAFSLYLALMDLRTHFKHNAYAAEKEWRYTNFAEARLSKVRSDRRGLYPYFPDAPILDVNDRLPIREILLGPKQDEEKGKHAVALLLSQHGYDPTAIKTYKSAIPYH